MSLSWAKLKSWEGLLLVLLIVVLLVSACGDDCDGLCLTEQEKTLILLQAIV